MDFSKSFKLDQNLTGLQISGERGKIENTPLREYAAL